MLNPNGLTPKDYWCVIYPPGAENKSYAAQIAFILSGRGVEMAFCLGDLIYAKRGQREIESYRECRRASYLSQATAACS